jgi:ABC-type multidrug transport system fused ATPase/permease subunit
MSVSIIPVVVLSIIYGKKMRTLQTDIQEFKAKMATVAEESFGNIRTVKAFSNEEEEIRKFILGSQEVYKVGVKKQIWGAGYSFLTQLCLYGGMALVIYIASLLYKNNKITIGAITSFYFYMIMLLWNFMIVSYSFGNFMSVIGASDKIFQIMDKAPKINTTGGDKIPECAGSLELVNVKFCYPTKENVQVLKGVSFSVDNKKNKVVALCGTSGCGKSSIISLIERFYDPTEG